MSIPYRSISSRQTPQFEPIFAEPQVPNNAGGFVYALDDWKALERFLILGSEGGTYYVGERTLTLQNAQRTVACLKADGARVVDLIVQISDAGRAPKNDPAIFALALASSLGDAETRAKALTALPKVCRIPTHLFHFLTYVQEHRGWGRGLKRAVAEWYNDLPIEKLAYQVVKYQSRDGFSNRDALRLSHPKTTDPQRQGIYRWIVDDIQTVTKMDLPVPPVIAAFEDAKDGLMLTTGELCRLIREVGLTREMLPTEALTKPEVWEALLEDMPITAMIRNLGNMSKVGLLTPLSMASRTVCMRLHDAALLKKGRVHPLALLVALKTYSSGRGLKGSGEWAAVPMVVDALNDAFYASFGLLTPTGKRILYALDVSGSMGWSTIAGMPLTPAEVAAAMAMVSARIEQDFYVFGFAKEFRDLGITPTMRLDDVLRKTSGLAFGATDCALPMIWALEHRVAADAFVVITDNETWAGRIHPSQALRTYRDQMGIPAKEVVMGMSATPFTIADPQDAGTLDVVGCDTATPSVVADFIRE